MGETLVIVKCCFSFIKQLLNILCLTKFLGVGASVLRPRSLHFMDLVDNYVLPEDDELSFHIEYIRCWSVLFVQISSKIK